MLKRILSALLTFAFCICIVPSVSAADFTADPEDNTYTIEIQGKTPGEDYVIIIVAGDYTGKDAPVPDENNIIYINQVAADGDGVISFTSFIPMTDSVGTVYISGDDKPSEEGVLMTDSGFGYAAGRLISYSGEKNTVVIPENIDSIASGAFDKASSTKRVIIRNGDISFDVGAFSEGMKIFLSPAAAQLKEFAAENGYSMIGDFDKDLDVDPDDLTYTLGGFAKGDVPISEDWDILLDLNSNGRVDLGDASVLLKYLAGAISDFFIGYEWE